MTNQPKPAAASFQYPEGIYTRLDKLNRTLPNVQKWSLISNALEIADGEPYDPIKTYDLFKFVYTKYNLGQLYELRQIIPLFYKPIPKDPEILSTFAGDSSKYMAKLIVEFCQEGYTHRYTDPNEPTCQCFNIEYREDERPPTCRECHGYEEPTKTDETTDEHFHLIPFPQRKHMNFPLFIWVLAFILEGYQYEFAEYEPTHVAWNRECTHQYFKFYARYGRPSKKELRDYQEMRILMEEHFVEIPNRPKPTPASPHITRFPNFPKRYDYNDEPKWWEPDYSRAV